MSDSNPAKRREVDPVFKQILTDYLTPLAAKVQTQVEVSRLPRTIDALVTIDDEQARQNIRSQTPFFYFRRYNQVEFKGVPDPLNIWDYFLVRGRANLYLGEKKILPQQMTVTLVCARKPEAFLRHEEIAHKFVEHQTKGYYYSQGDMLAVHLIVVNALAIGPKNYPLLLFASSKRKFRQFLAQLVAERNYVYLTYAYHVQPKMTQEVIDMSHQYATDDDFFNFIIQRIEPQFLEYLDTHPESWMTSLEKILPSVLPRVKPELLLASLAPEERLAGLEPEERLAGLEPEERLAGLEPEERKKLFDLLLQEQTAQRSSRSIPGEATDE